MKKYNSEHNNKRPYNKPRLVKFSKVKRIRAITPFDLPSEDGGGVY
jgi:hypothetical protein